MADLMDADWDLSRLTITGEPKPITAGDLRDARVRQDRAMSATDAADAFACDEVLRALQAGDAELVGRLAVNLYRAMVCGFALADVSGKFGARPKGYTDAEVIAKAQAGVVLPWGL